MTRLPLLPLGSSSDGSQAADLILPYVVSKQLGLPSPEALLEPGGGKEGEADVVLLLEAKNTACLVSPGLADFWSPEPGTGLGMWQVPAEPSQEEEMGVGTLTGAGWVSFPGLCLPGGIG